MIAVCFVVDKYICIVTLLGELAYGDSQPSSTTVHITGGREACIPLSRFYATWHPMTTTIHHWWKGNIHSIVSVQGELAPGRVTHRIRRCTSLTVGTVYTVLYDRIKQHGHVYVTKTNSSLHEKVVGPMNVLVYSVWWIWMSLPVNTMQSTFAMSQHPEYFLYKTHSNAKASIRVLLEHSK